MKTSFLLSAAMVAAGLKVSRSYDPTFAEAFVLRILTAANTQVIGWRRGRQLGLISLVASATGFYGAKPSGDAVTHKGWGLRRGADRAREVQVFRGLTVLSVQLTLASVANRSLAGEARGNSVCHELRMDRE